MLSIFSNKFILINIFRCSNSCFKVHKHSYSSVLINDRASVYSVLNPHIDFGERITGNKLQESISKRNLKISLKDINNLWTEYKSLESTKSNLEKSKSEIANKIKSYSHCKEKHQNEIEKLKLTGKILRQDLKNVTGNISNLEKTLLVQVLKLPNDLRDELFPNETEVYNIPKECAQHHLDIGEQLNLVEYISPTAYFLKNEAATFDLDVPSAVLNLFHKHNFIPMSNPDFSRNIVIEGLCIDARSVLKLGDEEKVGDLFVNGSASLLPFCSYQTKRISESIPIKYVTQGKNYQRFKAKEDGLYSVWQNSAVQVFAASSEFEVLEEFNKIIKLVTDIYLQTGLHFRIKKIPPPELDLFESIRLSVQVHSPYKNDFVEVGNISYYSDYLSKRFRMYYKYKNDKHFLHVISGTVLKVAPLLASILENYKDCSILSNICKNIHKLNK